MPSASVANLQTIIRVNFMVDLLTCLVFVIVREILHQGFRYVIFHLVMLEVQNCHLRQFHATRNAMTTAAAKILS